MNKGKRYRSTLCRVREIRDITRAHHEEGNQSRCYRAVWRRYIAPRYGICYDTYLKYLKEPLAGENEPGDDRDLKLS